MYCSYCGHQLGSDAKFCSNCGKAVNSESTSLNHPVSIATSGSGDYRLIFVDRNQCPSDEAEDLIVELLGYSADDADQFVDLAPIEIAENLSALQARTLAQAFTEYGCQVSIVNEHGDHVDLSEKATSSIFDENGNLLTKAALIIGALTLVNRVTSYRRYKKPSLLERLFKPRYQPAPIRRRKPKFSIFAPAPKPKPVIVQPRPHHRSAPAPRRNSAITHRPPTRNHRPRY